MLLIRLCGRTSAQPDPHPGSQGGQINKTINDQEQDEAQSLLLIKYNTRQKSNERSWKLDENITYLIYNAHH